jgi:hypothetical protein
MYQNDDYPSAKDPRQSIIDFLLDDLGRYVEDQLGGSVFKKADADPKGLGIEVQAPDKEGLKAGLGKAQDVVDQAPIPSDEASSGTEPSDDDIMQMLAEAMNEDRDDEDEPRR